MPMSPESARGTSLFDPAMLPELQGIVREAAPSAGSARMPIRPWHVVAIDVCADQNARTDRTVDSAPWLTRRPRLRAEAVLMSSRSSMGIELKKGSPSWFAAPNGIS